MKPLDPTDIRILHELQQDARQELEVIGRKVFKSTSTVSERIAKLQQRGVIKRFVAVLDREQVGRPLLAIVQVSLSVHTREALAAFMEQVNALAEVQRCLHLSGACDFILEVSVADSAAYYHILMDRICNNPNVVHVDTSFVLRECKSDWRFVL